MNCLLIIKISSYDLYYIQHFHIHYPQLKQQVIKKNIVLSI